MAEQVDGMQVFTADEKGAAHFGTTVSTTVTSLGVLADSGPCSGRSAWSFSGQDSGKAPL